MKSTQENKLSMYYAVQKVCSDNTGVWNGLPAFVSAFTNFQTNIGKIGEALEAQETSLQGVSVSKKAAGDAMVDKALDVANGVFAFASDTGNHVLKGRVDFSRSDLAQARDAVRIQRCQLICDEANAIVNSLGNHGVSSGDLSDLQAKINAFAETLAAPRTAITGRKGATNEISRLLHETDGILKEKLDKLVVKFKPAHPEFHRLYFDTRAMVTSGVRHEGPAPALSKEKGGNTPPPAQQKPAA